MREIEKKIFFVLFISFVLISTGICFAAEPVTERPIYTDGDSWIFVNRNKGKKVKHIFLREEKDKYLFHLESWGQLDNKEIFTKAVEVLDKKLEVLSKLVK